MKESADRAQNFIDLVNQRMDQPVREVEPMRDSGHFEGDFTVELGDINLADISRLRNQEDIQDVSTDIDAEIMDEVYSSVRNYAERRNNGYNTFRGLKAVEKGIPPAMITGAQPDTVEEWYEDFRNAGLTYDDEQEGETVTVEGEVFTEEAYHLMERLGEDENDEQAEEYIGQLFNSLSRRGKNQGEKLRGFLLMAETDYSVTEIAEKADTQRRTAYNWVNEWLEPDEETQNGEISLFRGEPSDRELTDFGKAAYDMIGNQYRRMDIASQMKAVMIENMEENRSDSEPVPYVPGNQAMVASHLDNPDIAADYMQRGEG